MTQPKANHVSEPGPSWEKEALIKEAVLYAEESFKARRGFSPDGFGWKDPIYGNELRLSRDGWLHGARWAQEKGVMKMSPEERSDEKAAAPGEESEWTTALREEVERFMRTNTFHPMEVTNFYIQAKLVLRELSSLKAENAALREELAKTKKSISACQIEWYQKAFRTVAKDRDTLRQDNERLKAIVGMFKVEGTDGCDTCETGRVSYFKANRQCTECNPESYETPKLKAPSDKDAGEGKVPPSHHVDCDIKGCQGHCWNRTQDQAVKEKPLERSDE